MKKGIYVCCSIYNSPILLLSFYSSPAIFFSVLRNTKIALSCFCLCHSSHTHTHHTCFRYGMTANDRSVSLINVSHQYRSILLLLLFFFSVALRFDLIVIVWCSNCIENSNGSAKMSRTNERKSYTKKKQIPENNCVLNMARSNVMGEGKTPNTICMHPTLLHSIRI